MTKDERRRFCQTCKAEFWPRATQIRLGHGKFCSQRCNTAAIRIITSPEILALSQQRRRENIAAGLIVWKTGPEHHSWTGGKEVHLARKKAKVAAEVASGEAARKLREYRKANPDKVREFARRRAGRKLGRLEYGSLPKIRARQKNKCAICGTSIATRSHVDHILPLARGGQHIAANIQLLCPPCNLAKSDRDPILHMQSLGKLL